MSSCSFGTSASLARLPKRDVVLRSRVKLGGIVIVRAGAGELGVGGDTITYMRSLDVRMEQRHSGHTEHANNDSEIVSETGNLAKANMG